LRLIEGLIVIFYRW